MRVFRVEHKVRRHGPYAGAVPWLGEFEREYCNCHSASRPRDHESECESWEVGDFHSRLMWNNSIGRPSPPDDGMGYPPMAFSYGFVSLNALWEWFDEFLNDLDYFGYEISEYEAFGQTYVGRTSGQVAFELRDSVRID